MNALQHIICKIGICYSYRLHVEYGSQSEEVGNFPQPYFGECSLGWGEFVTSMLVSYGYPSGTDIVVVGGITITTNKKTCPHFGGMHPTMYMLNGSRLLYMSGRKGFLFDRLDLHYEDC